MDSSKILPELAIAVNDSPEPRRGSLVEINMDIRQRIFDTQIQFSFMGEIHSAIYLFAYGCLPCALVGITYGWFISGSVA